MMELQEIKKQLVHTGLLEIVILMGQLRNKVNAESLEELEEITGIAFPDKLGDLSAFLCDNEADICEIIGDVLRSRIDPLTNPVKVSDNLSPVN